MHSPGVVPRWPPANQQCSARLQKIANTSQYRRGILVMLETVEGNHCVGLLIREFTKLTFVRHSGPACVLGGAGQTIRVDFQTDYPSCAGLRQFDGLKPVTASKIDDYLVFDRRQKVFAEQSFELASTIVNGGFGQGSGMHKCFQYPDL